MGLIITAIILTIIITALIIIGVKTCGFEESWDKEVKVGAWFLLGFIPMLTILFGIFTIIPANTVGIVYDQLNGGVQEWSYGEGLVLKTPFQNITKISTANRISKVTTYAQTEDSIYAEFEVSIIYKITADNVGAFYKRTNSIDITDNQLESLVKLNLQKTTINYDIYGVLGADLDLVRMQFRQELEASLLENYFITLISVSIDDVDAGSRIEDIIRTKGEALQQIEIAELERQRAEIEALKLQIEANADAEVIRILAQAQADKTEIEKSAIIEVIDQYSLAFPTLTEQEVARIVLQIIFYETWDGVLPTVWGSDSLGIIVDGLLD